MVAGKKRTFKLGEEQWAESLRLATAPQEERDRFWRQLGGQLGFDPSTVDWVRPLSFSAVVVPKAPLEPPGSPETASGQPLDVPIKRRAPQQERPADVACPTPGGKPGNKVVGERRVPAVVVFTEDRKLAMLDQCGCSRCGETHHGITYRKLRRPATLGGEQLTHWAFCPSTGEPVLVQIADVDADVRVPADLDRVVAKKKKSRADVLREN